MPDHLAQSSIGKYRERHEHMEIDCQMPPIREGGIGMIKATSINVKDYGAKGDGIADDLAALMAALNAAATGANVFFPVGTYRVAKPLPWSWSNVRMVGYGATITSPGVVVLEFVQKVSNVDICGLRIESTSKETNPYGAILSLSRPGTPVSLRNIRFIDVEVT